MHRACGRGMSADTDRADRLCRLGLLAVSILHWIVAFLLFEQYMRSPSWDACLAWLR